MSGKNILLRLFFRILLFLTNPVMRTPSRNMLPITCYNSLLWIILYSLFKASPLQAIFVKSRRIFLGEYSVASTIDEARETNLDINLDQLPGTIVVKDPYELPVLIKRLQSGMVLRQMAEPQMGSESARRTVTSLGLREIQPQPFLLSPPQLSLTYFNDKIYKRGSIYFSLENETLFSPDELYLLKKATSELETDSCIRFFQVPPDALLRHPLRRLLIFKSKEGGCACHKWQGGLVQRLALGSDCFLKKQFGLVHQLMHVLGFGHMHNSFDRDAHVAFNWTNIDSKYEEEFKLKLPSSATMGLPFDYDSVMAAPPYYATTNGRQTILPLIKTRGEAMGDLSQVSDMDRSKLNLIYSDQCNVRLLLGAFLDNRDDWNTRLDG